MRTIKSLFLVCALAWPAGCGGDDVSGRIGGTGTGSAANGGTGGASGAPATGSAGAAAASGNIGGGAGGAGQPGGEAATGGHTGGDAGGGDTGGDKDGGEGGGAAGASGGDTGGESGGKAGAGGSGGTGGTAGDDGKAGNGGTGGSAAGRCDDGTEALCKMLPPKCEDHEILAVQDSCYVCVNPVTCAPWGAQAQCEGDMECKPAQYCDLCATSSCPVCDDCVAACVDHGCRTESKLTCRCARPECGRDGVAVISNGCWICVSIESCRPTGEEC
jgi:hypothetical protein